MVDFANFEKANKKAVVIRKYGNEGGKNAIEKKAKNGCGEGATPCPRDRAPITKQENKKTTKKGGQFT